ncbi:MAG: ABC transporter substrate-binding protein [Thermodesulfobacteriota bacterium]
MKRVFTKAVLATTIGAFACGAGLATAADKTELVIVSWGGAYSASQQKAYNEPYMKKNPNVKIISDDSAAQSVAKLRAQTEAGNVTWDLVDSTAANAITLCDEGLVEEIDIDKVLAPAPDGTPASKDFEGMLISPCYIPQIVYSYTFGYRTDKVGATPPTTMMDIFDLKKYPGKRSLQKEPINNLEWALIADGVDPAKVYDVLATPAGVDRAFAKLETIKDKVVWWSEGAQPAQLLADGEVVIASAYNGRLFAAIEEHKQPIGMIWDWQVFDLDGWVVPKGTPNLKEVYKYLHFATDTQRLADQAKYISYGPARKSSAPLVGKHAELGIDMKPHMPTNPENSKHRLVFNYEFWADHKDELTQRFQAWLAK